MSVALGEIINVKQTPFNVSVCFINHQPRKNKTINLSPLLVRRQGRRFSYCVSNDWRVSVNPPQFVREETNSVLTKKGYVSWSNLKDSVTHRVDHKQVSMSLRGPFHDSKNRRVAINSSKRCHETESTELVVLKAEVV